jgi:hypothetical protein
MSKIDYKKELIKLVGELCSQNYEYGCAKHLYVISRDAWDDLDLFNATFNDEYCTHIHLVSDKVRDNKDIVIKCIKQEVWAFIRASDRLRDDDDVVALAAKESDDVLGFASDRLKNKFKKEVKNNE